ncbi:MAG: recombinase family protein [Sandaracinaceae bacterium]|nr:recombinase family protein [Sandaracinaceae bacterium]
MKRRTRRTQCPKTVAGYARVSTDEQAVSGISIDAQQAAITRYANAEGLVLGNIYIDAGVSASVPLADRPQGAELVARLRAGEISAVVVTKLDRAWRSAIDALTTTAEWRDRDIALHFVDLKLDTTTAVGRMFLTMLAGVAEMERNLISERTAAALAHIRMEGATLGGEPIGWVRTDDHDTAGRKRFVRDADEQTTISRIWKLNDRGMGFTAIAILMAFEAWPTKRGGRWHPWTVAKILARGREQSGPGYCAA